VATSYTKLIRNGLRTIADADTTLRTLTGRTTRILVPWSTIGTATKPVLVCMVSANNRIGGDGDKRRVQVLVAAFAEGTGAQTKVDDMIQRVREMLTPAAFQALTPTLDAWVAEKTDRDGGDESAADSTTTTTNTARADLDLIIEGSAPQ
jgi:hypothetical protein